MKAQEWEDLDAMDFTNIRAAHQEGPRVFKRQEGS